MSTRKPAQEATDIVMYCYNNNLKYNPHLAKHFREIQLAAVRVTQGTVDREKVSNWLAGILDGCISHTFLNMMQCFPRPESALEGYNNDILQFMMDHLSNDAKEDIAIELDLQYFMIEKDGADYELEMFRVLCGLVSSYIVDTHAHNE